MHPLAERVLSHIRRQDLLKAGDRVGVAVSGGIDSVALLRLLLELRGELGIVLFVVHFNHKLRGTESDADEEFVARLAHAHDLEIDVDCADVAGHAREEGISVETAARELRYGFFRRLIGRAEANSPCLVKPARHGAPQRQETLDEQVKPRTTLTKLATGHTLDDQAETVLMRLVRGTGLKGLGGIYSRIPVEDLSGEVSGEIVRPLLGTRRCELKEYLRQLNQPWREDSSNRDAGFTRNRIRQRILPLLEREFNPAVAENLAELADIARGEEDYWDNELSGWLGTVVHWTEPEWARSQSSASSKSLLVKIAPAKSGLQRRLEEPGPPVMNASVSRAWLLAEPLAVQRRLVKAIGDHAGVPFQFKHVQEILRFAAEDGPSGRELSLPMGWKLVREPDVLTFLAPDLRRQEPIAQDYEYELPLPGSVAVPETGTVMEAVRMHPESQATGYNREQLLDPDLLRGNLRVRNWRPGDRFWPAHTKSPKKIKELLQARHITGPARRRWPVVASGDEVVWVRGFPSPAGLKAKDGQEAVLIRESADSSS